ncbi:hypothetical protein NDU88_004342 [Pleurodeles waltl]|uniref:Uncharacterized protein n=1 Tax=Pleurodeles waltl TaxID=8319 RepID=A0AAV7UES2_PLEWA|nr:hypothetical protein NDU88_004342 [Pleurodeles waltl]
MLESDIPSSLKDSTGPDIHNASLDDNTSVTTVVIVLVVLLLLKICLCCYFWVNKPEKAKLDAKIQCWPKLLRKSPPQAHSDILKLSKDSITLLLPTEDGYPKITDQQNAKAPWVTKQREVSKHKSHSTVHLYFRNHCLLCLKTKLVPNQRNTFICGPFINGPSGKIMDTANMMCKKRTEDSNNLVLEKNYRSPRPRLAPELMAKACLQGPSIKITTDMEKKAFHSHNISSAVVVESKRPPGLKETYHAELHRQEKAEVNVNQPGPSNNHSPCMHPRKLDRPQLKKQEDFVSSAALDNGRSSQTRERKIQPLEVDRLSLPEGLSYPSSNLTDSLSLPETPTSSSNPMEKPKQVISVEVCMDHVEGPKSRSTSLEPPITAICANANLPMQSPGEEVELLKPLLDIKGTLAWLSGIGSVFTVPSVTEWLKGTVSPTENDFLHTSISENNPLEKDYVSSSICPPRAPFSDKEFCDPPETNSQEQGSAPPVAGVQRPVQRLPFLLPCKGGSRPPCGAMASASCCPVSFLPALSGAEKSGGFMLHCRGTRVCLPSHPLDRRAADRNLPMHVATVVF